MRRRPGFAVRLLVALLAVAGAVTGANAQDAVVVACVPGGRCTYQKVYSPTLNGQDTVKLVAAPAGNGAASPTSGRSGHLNGLAGVYLDPSSGQLRVMSNGGSLGDVVTSSKAPRVPAGAAAWTIEYRDQPKSKTRTPVGPDQFVALLRGPRLSLAVVDFLKSEITTPRPHPMHQALIQGGVAFAEGSTELQAWRQEVRDTMKRSLEDFRAEAIDPTRLENLLAEGVAAMRVHRLVAADPHQDEALQQDLSTEYQRLVDRFLVVRTFKKAGLDDEFLEKLGQIGLARWSRPDLVAQTEASVQASATLHHQRAAELFSTGQYGGAFDEARLASGRARCNDDMNELYYKARIEFVNRNTIASLPEYTKENRSILQQIVRELQSATQDASLTQDRTDYIRKRLAEGERLDKDYLPLQLKKAEFLANIGELMTAFGVVTDIERTVTLGRTEAEQWLGMDATLNGKLVTLRQGSERQLKEQISAGQFKEALSTALTGLRADPANQRFLYYAAVAAAVLRDDVQSKRLAQQYLRLMVPACGLEANASARMLDLFRREMSDRPGPGSAGRTPNWISGETYAPGEAFYDPVSGSFNAHLLSSVARDGKTLTSTEFSWDGFLVTSIKTTVGPAIGDRHVLLDLEPVYDSKHVYMSGIGPRANPGGQRRMALRYSNSPEFDPLLASAFTGTQSTRGWAGNPFFHPWLWNDIFLFDLKYDERGRIKEAIPVAPDVTRAMSQYSEALTFTWDGTSTRLLAISGARYRREMIYDNRGRLSEEKITYPSGKGSIHYHYQGDSTAITAIECEDNFYDKAQRIVHLQPTTER